jgi:hypothetical protein
VASAGSTENEALPPRTWLALALAAAVGLITLDGGFVFDDHRAIEHSAVVQARVPAWEAFTRDFWGQPLEPGKLVSYRPLMPLVWRGVWALSPTPLPFHLLSLLLHVAATAAFVFAGRRLGCGRALLGAAALVFAVHATHAEAVGANVSHADLLSAVLGLCAVGLCARAQGLAAGAGLAALLLVACLAKESAFVFAGAAIALLALREGPVRDRIRVLVPIAAVTLAVIALQVSLERVNDPRYSQTLAYDARGLPQLLLGLAFYAHGMAISFVPHRLGPKHSYAAWDLSTETLLPHALPGALLLSLSLLALLWAWRTRNGPLTALLVLLIGPVLTNTGLIVKVPNELPERTYYPAVMAASVLIAALVRRFARGRAEQLVLAAIVLGMLAQRYRAQRPWHDELALWRHGLAVEPKSAELNMFMAHAEAEAGRADPALWHALLTAYIASQRPRRVEWAPIEALERLPVRERWTRAPALLSPADPCRFALGALGALQRELPTLERRALSGFRARYPGCFAPPGAARTRT